MSAPRAKRLFTGDSVDPTQRQITSFFTTRPGPAPAGPPRTAPESNLPSDVQSNLLSVGMRIRKSVPEGYKTGTYSNFKLWSDSASTPAPVVPTNPAFAVSRKRQSAAPSQRELMPFCGINKIGGMFSQPVPEQENSDDSDVPGLDDMPGLSSSQESVESVESTASNGRRRKRLFGDDDADGNGSNEPAQMWVDHNAWLEGEVSPRSLAPSGWANARILAVPRKSRRGKTAGQENIPAGDFEDADFLVTPDMDMSDA